MSYVTINEVSKQYGQTQVLANVSLNIRKGELVTLLGPSGCGKSTLLRCISGLTELEKGRIVLHGTDITDVPARERGVGMVFQSYALFPNMNVYDNIAFGLRMHGANKAKVAERVEEMLRIVDLREKKHAYPHELSGGQQQRVALARSLAIQPKLLLLDEPLSALDAKIRRNLRMELRQIQKELEMTTIFVTHDQEEALMISDRICVMDRGAIVQIGTPEEIYTSPKSEFVARFIGNYNVLTKEELDALIGVSGPAGTRFAIRPEGIWLKSMADDYCSPVDAAAAAAAEQSVWSSEGRVSGLTVLGNVLRYTVEVGGRTITVDALNDRRKGWIQEGAPVRVQIPHDECKILDINGGA